MSIDNLPARQKILVAAVDMLRRNGPGATSIRELARHGRAPLGSTYHYFPGGKPQLLAEAVDLAAAAVAVRLDAALQRGALEGVRAFCAEWREVLLASACQAGCPVAAVAMGGGNEDLASALAAAADGFARWERLLQQSLSASLPDEAEAAALASLIVAAAEGAIAMCRARRDIAPFDRVAGQLERVIGQALAG